MKETTGELNATVVVMLAIGILIAFFYYTLWPIIKTNFDKSSQCSKAICESCPSGKCDVVTCHPKNDPDTTFECIYKG